MLPMLRPGDGLVAVRSSRLRRGQIRCFEHPDRSDFWLVKRVGDIRGDRFEALSDNPTADAVDSRRFGLVAVHDTFLMVLKVPLAQHRSVR